MHGALYLRFLFDAAIAFSHDPAKQRFGWITRQQASTALKKVLRPSLRISGLIKDYDEQELFDWVRRSESRYKFIYDLRRQRVSDLAGLSDKLNLAALDLNKSIYDLVDHPPAGMTEEQVQAEIEKKHQAFLKSWFPEMSAAPGVITASPGKEISEAKEERPATTEPAPINTEDHFTATARAGVNGSADLERFRPSAVTPPSNITPPSPISQVQTRVSTIIESEPIQQVMSGTQVFVRRNIVDRAPGFVKGFLGEIPGLSGGAANRVAGQAAKTVANQGLKRGLQAASGLAGPEGLLLAAGIEAADLARKKAKKLLTIIIFVVVFVFVFMWLAITQVMQTQPLLVFKDDGSIVVNPGGGEGGGTNNPGTGTSGDISSCSFIRSDRNPPGAQYKSPLILSYFKEASEISGIPLSMLAAIARVESPGLTSQTDEGIQNYQCAVSPAGALGVMQIVPSPQLGGQANAYCESCVELGANFLGKTAAELTREDYCDPRRSIVLAAGFTIRKIGFLYTKKTENKWDPAWTTDRAAIGEGIRGYYGCLKYPSCTNGPYDYSEDVWNSVQSCQETITQPGAVAASCPLSGSTYVSCGSFKNPSNSCGHGRTDLGYPACNLDQYASCPGGQHSEEVKSAIDVVPTSGNRIGAEVRLPTINGENLQWQKVNQTGLGGNWGYRVDYRANSKDGKRIDLDLTHIDPVGDPELSSGGLVGRLSNQGGNTHLHVSLKINGQIVEAKDTGLCY